MQTYFKTVTQIKALVGTQVWDRAYAKVWGPARDDMRVKTGSLLEQQIENKTSGAVRRSIMPFQQRSVKTLWGWDGPT